LASEIGRAGGDPAEWMARKVALLRELFALSQRGLLLPELDALDGLLARKGELLTEIDTVDRSLAPELAKVSQEEAGRWQGEVVRLVEAILENEQAMQARIGREQSQLRKELVTFDQEQRLRRYLEGSRNKGRNVNVKK
jgi:hypothetical protein